MDKSDIDVGNYAPDFEIPGIDDQVHHLARYLDKFKAIAVVFLSNKCPQVQGYIERLNAIQNEFHQQGFTLIGINSNDSEKSPEDSFEEMKQFAAQYQLNFPYLRDPTQDVAQGFGAEKTPQVFLLDKNATVCYRGQIDDQPNSADSVKVSYLRQSIEALLRGETIAVKETEPLGSPLIWRD